MMTLKHSDSVDTSDESWQYIQKAILPRQVIGSDHTFLLFFAERTKFNKGCVFVIARDGSGSGGGSGGRSLWKTSSDKIQIM